MESTVRSIIVDDEQNCRALLSSLLKKNCSFVSVEGAFETVKDAFSFLSANSVDLIFLDIELAGESGFDLLEKIKDYSVSVIFTTAFDRYALKAIKYSAMDYLLKPIDADELVSAVDKVRKRVEEKGNDNLKFLLETLKRKEDLPARISLPTGNAYEIVNIKDIIRCESDGHYTSFIVSGNRKFFVSTGLKHYEDILPAEKFIRVHHSHLINIDHVVRYLKSDGGYAVMTDNSQVEISRRKKDAFVNRLQNLAH